MRKLYAMVPEVKIKETLRKSRYIRQFSKTLITIISKKCKYDLKNKRFIQNLIKNFPKA